MTEKKNDPLGIGHWPKWKQITFFAVAFVVLFVPAMAGLEYVKTALRGGSTEVRDDSPPKLQQTVAPPSRENVMEVLDKAKAGDYLAQRNLAYGYAAFPYPGQQKNRVLACAWYLVVVNSNHPQADNGDVSNVQVYCGSLDADLLETAKSRATQFLAEITSTQKLTKLP